MKGEVETNSFPSRYTKIIFFDGVCNLCQASVQFILARDEKAVFIFSSLQSNYAKQFLEEKNMDTTSLKTFILVEDNSIYTRSTAALKAVKQLSGLWPLLYGFIILPPFIRDAVYNWVASNRYNWFGKQETCWLPREEWKNRFLS